MYTLYKHHSAGPVKICTHKGLDQIADAAAQYALLHGETNFCVDDDDALAFEMVCENAIFTFDDTENNTVCIEELSELQKEVCKRMRGAENNDHMSEEIADAEIVIEKLKLRYGLRERAEEWRRKKLERLRRKIEGRAP